MKRRWHRRVQSLNTVQRECVDYFKKEPIWNRVLTGFREKYASYGSFSGTVQVKVLCAADIDALEGFFGRSFHGQKSASISAERFAQALFSSRYGEISPVRLLELYFGTEMMSKKEKREKDEADKQKVLDAFEAHCRDTYAQKLSKQLIEASKNNMKKGLKEWERLLFLEADIINHLPYRSHQTVYLPVFAAQMTKNPHAFDKGTVQGELLYQMVLLDLEHREIGVKQSEVFASYQRQRSFLECGILLDDVSNYVLLYNTIGTRKDGNCHRGLEGFAGEQDMLQLPLTVLSKLKRLESPDGTLFISENPSVFAVECAENPNHACMCMNGQPKLAALVALELFAESGTVVYYSGDLDPEGLWIAQRLSLFYPGEFHFLHMGVQDYEKCRSEEIISEARLKQLDRITDDRLIEAARQMRREKRAGYQESFLI